MLLCDKVLYWALQVSWRGKKINLPLAQHVKLAGGLKKTFMKHTKTVKPSFYELDDIRSIIKVFYGQTVIQ